VGERVKNIRWTPGARAVAARVLVTVEQDPAARGPEALASELSVAGVGDPRERALATELVYGVLRQQRRLDHTLAPLVRQGLGRLEPVARALLRVGAYQILFLDRIPPPIAVSATQDAARQVRAGRITGLLNGVLRKVVARGERLPGGGGDGAVGVRASLPDWIVAELRAAYGDDAEAEALALRESAPTTVRPTLTKGGAEACAAKLAEEGFAAAPGPYGTLVVTGPGDPFATEAFAAGHFVPQDPASLAVVDLLGDVAGKRVADLCAGRGLKATALADRGAEVVALDIGAGKLAALRDLAGRLGLADRVTTRVADLAAGPPDIGTFDLVLVDAPCTGLGTLRRHPEIAWRRRPADLASLTVLQERLIANAAPLVAPGGALVWAVCSFARAEGSPPLPSGLTEEVALDLRPSDGLDAFQARRLRLG